MCSGCSGDYGGEFDDSGEPVADGDDANSLAWNRGEPEKQRSQPESQKTRGFEAKLPSRGDDESATVRGCKDESVADVWEILVSGTRIVEIRMIAANECELKELARIGAGARPPRGQQSTSPSAKYYRTRRPRAKNSGDRAEMASSRGIGCLLAVEFGKWMQWARKRLAISRAKNSR